MPPVTAKASGLATTARTECRALPPQTAWMNTATWRASSRQAERGGGADIQRVAAGVLADGHQLNYVVKSSLLQSFLESVPDVDAKLKAPLTADRKFEDVVKSAQDAAVLEY